jgi:hypothetical protein
MLAASDHPKGDNAEVVPACSICAVGGGFAPLSRSGSSGAHGGNPTTRAAHGAAAGQSRSGDSTGRKASVKGAPPIRAIRPDANIASLFFMAGKSCSAWSVSILAVGQAQLFPDIDAGLGRARRQRLRLLRSAGARHLAAMFIESDHGAPRPWPSSSSCAGQTFYQSRRFQNARPWDGSKPAAALTVKFSAGRLGARSDCVSQREFRRSGGSTGSGVVPVGSRVRPASARWGSLHESALSVRHPEH